MGRAPGRARTCNLPISNRLLSPIELQGQVKTRLNQPGFFLAMGYASTFSTSLLSPGCTASSEAGGASAGLVRFGKNLNTGRL